MNENDKIDQVAQEQEDHDSMVESDKCLECKGTGCKMSSHHIPRDCPSCGGSGRKAIPPDTYCGETADHKHVIDFHSVTQADVDPSELVMDVTCKACGRSGAFRIPEVSEIDW